MTRQNRQSAFEIITLSNGLRIAYLKVSGTRLFHAGFTINTGSKNDENIPGLAHCLEHMLFKGTEKRKTIHVLNSMESVGGEINAFTTKELTTIYGTSTSNNYIKLIDILCDVIFRSTFPIPELEKEKKVILDEINMYLDTPEENIYDEFQEMIFEGHPLAHNILGTPQSVESVQQSDLKAFVNKHYQPQNMVLSVIGNISIERILKGLNQFLPNQTVIVSHTQNLSIEEAKQSKAAQQGVEKTSKAFQSVPVFHQTKKTDFNQAYAIIGNYAYSSNDKNRWSFSLLNHLLGGPSMNSRLNLAIREKYGYTYNVESGYATFEETGLFHCFVGSEPKYLQKSVDLIYKELEKLNQNILGSVQLSRAKNQYVGQLIVSNENRPGLMIHMGQSLVKHNRITTIEEAIARIKEITADEIQASAKAIFQKDNFSSLLYLPE